MCTFNVDEDTQCFISKPLFERYRLTYEFFYAFKKSNFKWGDTNLGYDKLLPCSLILEELFKFFELFYTLLRMPQFINEL